MKRISSQNFPRYYPCYAILSGILKYKSTPPPLSPNFSLQLKDLLGKILRSSPSMNICLFIRIIFANIRTNPLTRVLVPPNYLSPKRQKKNNRAQTGHYSLPNRCQCQMPIRPAGAHPVSRSPAQLPSTLTFNTQDTH